MLFSEGRTNIHEEKRHGPPTIMNKDLTKKIDEQIRQNQALLYAQA